MGTLSKVSSSRIHLLGWGLFDNNHRNKADIEGLFAHLGFLSALFQVQTTFPPDLLSKTHGLPEQCSA